MTALSPCRWPRQPVRWQRRSWQRAKVYAVNIGTLLCLLINGPMIALAGQHLWHNLHHNIALPKAISDRAE
nr:hypothetical protein [Lactobacillus delbrueckii]